MKETDCGGTAGLTAYCVTQAKSVPQLGLHVTNQFHASESPLVVDTIKPDRLLVPTAVSLAPPSPTLGPSSVDPFKCYTVKVSAGQPKFTPILGVLADSQFTSGPRAFDLTKPARFCTPAAMNGEGTTNPASRLLCLSVKPSKGLCASGPNAGHACSGKIDCGGTRGVTALCVPQPKFQGISGVLVQNELDSEQVDTLKEDELCVPSQESVP